MGIFDKAKTKVQSWHKLEIVPKNIRDSTMGNIINLTMTEHCAYRIVSQDVEVGALPGYTLFLLIPLVAMIEALLAPWVAWLGYKTRRKMILTWSLGIIGISSAWLFLPSPINLEQTEICNSTNSNTEIMYTELSMRTSIRVMLTIGMAISFCLARVATWSHVIAYTDDIAPERMSVHVAQLACWTFFSSRPFQSAIIKHTILACQTYHLVSVQEYIPYPAFALFSGILIIARVLGLLFHNFLSQAADQNILVALVIITVFTTLNTLRLYFEIPKVIQDTGALKAIPMNDRGYFKSLKRVLFNFVAVSQMIAMGLLAAALWGFGYNQEEIIKTNFSILPITGSIVYDHVLVIRYIVVIFAVVYMGVKQSAPIRQKYDIAKGLAISFKMTLFAMILYVLIIAIPHCAKGDIAGLESGNEYANPQCSLSCGCVPRWKEFSPVCVVDTMTTYVSPCEAGCTGMQNINSLPVYTNCSCAASGHAIPGACSNFSCQISYNLHEVLFGLILTVSVVAFQAQSMVIIRSVDPRDKSIAMGVMWSAIAIITFVCGNNIFYSIDLNNCIWRTGERCQLHGQWFSHLVGITCIILTFMSLIVIMTARKCLRGKRRDDVDDESNA